VKSPFDLISFNLYSALKKSPHDKRQNMSGIEIEPAEELIQSKIYIIRGQKIMLDRDLAELYGVETKRLKEAVRRNLNRFPIDFMFELNINEMERWRTQIASSSELKKGLRYKPFCFTEPGVTMLSCILNSDRAIEVNIRIIRVFIKMRELIINHKDILLRIEKLEKNLIDQGGKTKKNENDIQVIFTTLRKLLNTPSVPRPRVGFRRSNEND
jgi:hypothetical protein